MEIGVRHRFLLVLLFQRGALPRRTRLRECPPRQLALPLLLYFAAPCTACQCTGAAGGIAGRDIGVRHRFLLVLLFQGGALPRRTRLRECPPRQLALPLLLYFAAPGTACQCTGAAGGLQVVTLGSDTNFSGLGVTGCSAQRNKGGGAAGPARGTFAEQSTPALPACPRHARAPWHPHPPRSPATASNLVRSSDCLGGT